ncbi:Methyltransferase domain protein [uncultured archaeon]|nr:Methyltransferase domain protein [uncultured archaeon]
MINREFLKHSLNEIICCPICKCELKIDGDELKWLSCFKKYQINDGILVLMAANVPTEQADELKLREELASKYKNYQPEEKLKILSQYHCLPVMLIRAKDFRTKFDSIHWLLDVGCGFGWYWRNTKGDKLILMDFALENLKSAQSFLKDEKQAILIQADAANLPIKTQSVSGIWSVQVTQHFPDSVMKSFLSEVNRVLKDRFLIEIYNLNPAKIHMIIYRLFGKNFHTKGKLGDMLLNRLSADELTVLWKDVKTNAKLEIGYSEMFFHPDFNLKPRFGSITIIENILTKVPWIAHTFARQIHVEISPKL